MILNERQYRITRATAERIAKQIEDVDSEGRKDVTAKQRGVLVRAATHQLNVLRAEIAEFEVLRKGAIPIAPIRTIEELPLALIRARIARGWTQAKLAEELDVAEQQVQRDEVNAYRGASVERLGKIGEVLGVRLGGVAGIEPESRTRQADARWRKPLLVMLLQAVRQRHRRAVAGRLEFQKLVLVMEERLRAELGLSAFRFEPYLLGGYDYEIDDDLDFLAQHGFVLVRILPQSKAQADPATDVRKPAQIDLGPRAAAWLERFLDNDQLASPERKRAVYGQVALVSREYGGMGARGLVEHTYEHHEHLATRSLIREEVAKRTARKRKGK